MMSVLSPDLPGINVNVGESINLAPGSLAPLSPTKRSRTLSEGAVYLTKLPPAVANVPAEHIRTYIHSKRVNHYLVGNTLGEGSFAKVKEAFHSLVGEKVSFVLQCVCVCVCLVSCVLDVLLLLKGVGLINHKP